MPKRPPSDLDGAMFFVGVLANAFSVPHYFAPQHPLVHV